MILQAWRLLVPQHLRIPRPARLPRTALRADVVSNNASVVLMIPVAYDAALQLGADPFAFVLAVTFAASTAMLTPIGYQTNLMVYGPGGYRFSDFARVGAPLQLLLTVVTTLGIVWLYGV